jgi:3',5'-cyclic AMP phosphodiesterase CpdA
MSDTITLAQLSDVHLAPVRGLALRHLNVKRGLGYLNWQRSRRHVHRKASLDLVVADMKAHRPDHIAVTGDLINLGLPAEYEAARAWLESLGPPQDVTVIPGNHDIYTHVRGHPGVARWSEFMRADAWGAGLKPQTVDGFPFVRRIGPVALICLNSAEKTPPFVAAGRLGERQIADLADLLERTHREGLVRVVLIHHPPLPQQAPARRALRDAAALERVLSEHGAELVLHGHNHRDNHVDFAWGEGRIPVIGVASGSVGRVHKGEPLGRYNLLHIKRTPSGAHIECITRGLDASGRIVEQVDRKSFDSGSIDPRAFAAP